MTQNGNGNYNPTEHLVQIKSKDGSMKAYYPAAWRLYELSLKYPNANFSSEVLFFDIEKNTCLMKVRLYLGPSYELSDKKAEAHKSGPYSSLDKVETAAMARAARNFGIGTEYALEFEAEDMAPAPKPAPNGNSKRLNDIYAKGKAASKFANPDEMIAYIGQVLETQIITRENLGELAPAELTLVEDAIAGSHF